MLAKVCLVVVTYNRFSVLNQTLLAIQKQELLPDYFVLVDNHSTDGTPELIRQAGYPSDLLVLDSNLGYGAGLSLGMKHAMAKYNDIRFFWLMDDDSRPEPSLLTSLLGARGQIGKPGLISLAGFVDTVWRGPIPITRYAARASRLVHENVFRVDHALIDGALVDAEVVRQVGTPREDLFMMCEDLEYGRRLVRNGFGVYCQMNPQLISRLHLGGGTPFSKGTLWRGYYHSRNHLAILREYFTFKGLATYLIRQTKYLLAALAAPDRFERMYLRMLGIFHGLTGKMGKTLDPSNMKFISDRK